MDLCEGRRHGDVFRPVSDGEDDDDGDDGDDEIIVVWWVL